MRCLFVDVDGVLNKTNTLRWDNLYEIDPELLGNLAKIVRETGTKIVLSSDWRHDTESVEVLFAAFESVGIMENAIDETPYLQDDPRAAEISDWLATHEGVEKFAIIDDDPKAGIGMEDHFFRTNYTEGLSEEIAQKVIEFLK